MMVRTSVLLLAPGTDSFTVFIRVAYLNEDFNRTALLKRTAAQGHDHEVLLTLGFADNRGRKQVNFLQASVYLVFGPQVYEFRQR